MIGAGIGGRIHRGPVKVGGARIQLGTLAAIAEGNSRSLIVPKLDTYYLGEEDGDLVCEIFWERESVSHGYSLWA